MAQKFIDSFDLYNSADLSTRWTGGNNGCTIQSGVVRTGNNALSFNATSGSGQNLRSMSFPLTARFIASFACYPTGGDSTDGAIFGFYDSTTNIMCAELRYNSVNSTILVYSNNTLLGNIGTLPFEVWNALGLDATFSSSGAGTIKAYLNGALLATFNTVNTGGNTADTCIFGTNPSQESHGIVAYIDDFILYDGTGSTNNVYGGDQKVLAFVPNGEGRVDQWTPNGASPNYVCVNEIPPDGDTTYVSDATANNEDCYTLPALPAGVSGINGVQVSAFARKDDSTDRAIALGVGNGTSEDYGSNIYLGESYQYFESQFDENPLTTAPWSTADFTTLQAAIKVAV